MLIRQLFGVQKVMILTTSVSGTQTIGRFIILSLYPAATTIYTNHLYTLLAHNQLTVMPTRLYSKVTITLEYINLQPNQRTSLSQGYRIVWDKVYNNNGSAESPQLHHFTVLLMLVANACRNGILKSDQGR